MLKEFEKMARHEKPLISKINNSFSIYLQQPVRIGNERKISYSYYSFIFLTELSGKKLFSVLFGDL